MCAEIRKKARPPSYSSREYWANRFTSESYFEWLGDGETTVIPALSDCLSAYASSPTILHLGCGNSDFGLVLKNLWLEKGFSPEHILNIDYTQEAIDTGSQREIEKEEAGVCRMQWLVLDLLDVQAIERLHNAGHKARFATDKSTADAIACGMNITVTSTDVLFYDRWFLDEEVDGIVAADRTYEPTEILLIHLARLISTGGYYLSLSYSSSRFDLLNESSTKSKAGRLWQLVEKRGFLLDKITDTSTVPERMHYLWTLRRL